jgi:hypothetical protein
VTVTVDPAAMRDAARLAAHDSWTVRLAADTARRVLAAAQLALGDAGVACTEGLQPLLDAAVRVADAEARLAEALRTLADTYPHVDGQTPADRHRPGAAAC